MILMEPSGSKEAVDGDSVRQMNFEKVAIGPVLKWSSCLAQLHLPG